MGGMLINRVSRDPRWLELGEDPNTFIDYHGNVFRAGEEPDTLTDVVELTPENILEHVAHHIGQNVFVTKYGPQVQLTTNLVAALENSIRERARASAQEYGAEADYYRADDELTVKIRNGDNVRAKTVNLRKHGVIENAVLHCILSLREKEPA